MNKRILTSTLLAGGLLVNIPTVQAADIEANVALATDYVFRGFSQTNEEPAISGGFDYDFGNGFSVGTWASNVNFGDSTSSEVDLYGGYSFEVSDGVSIDLSYVYFAYPGETDSLNYSEFVAGVGVGDLGFSLVYSPDYFGSESDAIVLNADYAKSLGENLGLSVHLGYSDVDEDNFFDAGENSYIDYSIGLSTTAAGVDLGLTLYGTDLDNIDAADDRVVFSISKSL